MKLTISALLFANVALMASAAVLPRLAPGAQFVTGPCTTDIECETGCCGFKTGVCAGRIIAQTRDGGCGFGDAQPGQGVVIPVTSSNGTNAVQVEAVKKAPKSPNAPGSLTITQACQADADCDTTCCGFKTGVCAGQVIAQTRDGGCGFGEDTPNKGSLKFSTAPVPGSVAARSTNAPGSLTITQACQADADCDTACCGFKTGVCAGRIIAQSRDGGCGFGENAPNAGLSLLV